jgi:hypothetical protein
MNMDREVLKQKVENLLESAVDECWAHSDWRSSRYWTVEIKRRLCKLGSEEGYEVCCSGPRAEERQWGEWLYDLCWLEPGPKKGIYARMPLAFESEWALSIDEVMPDFQKLVFSAANLCVMLWQNRSIDDLKQDSVELKEQITAAGDDNGRYVLAGLDLQQRRIVFF